MKFNVKYTKPDGSSVIDDEISRVFLVSATDKAVIFSIETKTKYPKIEYYSPHGCWLDTKQANLAKITVDDIPFDNVVVVAEPGRYNLFLIFFQDVQDNSPEVTVNCTKG